jgi:hypothetical protein
MTIDRVVSYFGWALATLCDFLSQEPYVPESGWEPGGS